jgi:hypothetical protein
MKLSRRAFLIAAGASCAFGFDLRAARSRLFVIDTELSDRLRLDPRTRVTPLTGDAGWLWHEHLIHEAAHGLSGLTRPADAFILTRLAADLGLPATQRMIDADAVVWTLEARRIVSLE